MTKSTLRRIESSHDNLRTETVEGYYFLPPTEGFTFCFYAKSLEADEGIRIVMTTPVVEIVREDEVGTVFRTANSVYEVVP